MRQDIHLPPYRATPKDRTFDVGPSAPLIDESRHAATIVAEVSAAAAAQASKEFRRMREPKIMFRSCFVASRSRAG